MHVLERGTPERELLWQGLMPPWKDTHIALLHFAPDRSRALFQYRLPRIGSPQMSPCTQRSHNQVQLWAVVVSIKEVGKVYV